MGGCCQNLDPMGGIDGVVRLHAERAACRSCAYWKACLSQSCAWRASGERFRHRLTHRLAGVRGPDHLACQNCDRRQVCLYQSCAFHVWGGRLRHRLSHARLGVCERGRADCQNYAHERFHQRLGHAQNDAFPKLGGFPLQGQARSSAGVRALELCWSDDVIFDRSIHLCHSCASHEQGAG